MQPRQNDCTQKDYPHSDALVLFNDRMAQTNCQFNCQYNTTPQSVCQLNRNAYRLLIFKTAAKCAYGLNFASVWQKRRAK